MTDDHEAGPLFYDSETYQFPPHTEAVMAYCDGQHTAPPGLRAKYKHVHSMTVLGGDGRIATRAIALDYEPGNPAYVPGRLYEWAARRLARGQRAIVYSDRSDLARAISELEKLATHENLLHWVATGDGKLWPREDLQENIADQFRIYIPLEQLYGCQGLWEDTDPGSGGPWDTSLLYGRW